MLIKRSISQSQYTETGQTSPSADPLTPGAWQGSHWGANFKSLVQLDSDKSPLQQAGIDPEICRSRGAIILTDSMNLLQKVESGMGCPDWHTAMHSLRLQRLLWIYCPGHAGVSGNERADRLTSTADIISGLQLGRAEVLRGLRNFLSTDKPEHHSIDRLKERGVGERKRPTFHPPRPRTICVQPDKYWHCFEDNLGETAKRRGGARMGLSERYDAILS